MAQRKETREIKQLRARVNRVFNLRCNRMPIPVMKITELFNVGLASCKAGDDDQALGDKLVAFAESVKL